MVQGIFVIVVGPSGSGKNALTKSVYARYADIVVPVSCTTRAMRPGEKDGDMYYFLSQEEFKKRIAEDVFLEWAEYGGHLYGTLKSEILPRLAEGKMVMRDVEVQGALQIKSSIPSEKLVTIFIDAGSWEDLEKRIRARAPITEEELSERKSRYEIEMTFKQQADFVIDNPDGLLEEGARAIEAVIISLRKRIGLA